MLTKIVLHNFQCHKKLELELDKFSLLVGGSNSGKSSVLRAIRGVLRNDSVGNYVKIGEKALKVELTFDDGYEITWEKGSGVNKYLLKDPTGAVTEFSKVGSDVPTEVQEVLKLSPIALKGTDKLHINLHSQLESPFLISSTPGYVAKVLGELTSASQLYSAVSEGNRELRASSTLKKTRKEDLETLYDKQKQFPDLFYIDTLLDEAEKLRDEATAANGTVEFLVSAKTQIEDSVDKIADLERSVSNLTDVASVDLSELAKIGKDLDSAVSIFNTLNVADREIDRFEHKIAEMQLAETADLTELVELDEKLEDLNKAWNSLRSLKSKNDQFETDIRFLEQQLLNFEKEELVLFEQLEECPECGQELTREGKTALVEGKQHVHS